MRYLLFPVCLHVGHRNCFKSQAEYKKFETQVLTKFFSCICNFFLETFIAVCFNHNSLTVCPTQSCTLRSEYMWLKMIIKTTVHVGTKLPYNEKCQWSSMKSGGGGRSSYLVAKEAGSFSCSSLYMTQHVATLHCHVGYIYRGCSTFSNTVLLCLQFLFQYIVYNCSCHDICRLYTCWNTKNLCLLNGGIWGTP